MELKEIPVGTVVGIRKSSKYYGKGLRRNPADRSGVVTRVLGHGGLNYRVVWDHNGEDNRYRRKDLKYWKGPRTGNKGGVGKRPVKEEKPKEPVSAGSLVEEAIKRMEEAEGPYGVARYAFLKKDGGVVVNQNTACHVEVLSYRGKADVVGILASIKRCGTGEPQQRKDALAYYHWLFNESPWKDAFLWKDAKACVGKGYVLCSTDVPGNLLQGGLIASRTPWEFKSRVTNMALFMEEGLDGSTSYLLASFFLIERRSVSKSLHGGGHYPIDPGGFYAKGIKDFLNNTPQELQEDYNKLGVSCVRGVHAMFFGAGGDSFYKRADKLLKGAGSSSKKLATNPFTKAKKEEGVQSVSVKNLCAYVKEKGLV